MTECTICLGEHDEAIHQATLRIRKWFRRQIEPRPIQASKPKTLQTAEQAHRLPTVSKKAAAGSKTLERK